MDDLMMEDAMTEEDEKETPGIGEPEPEEPEDGDPGITLDEIVRRFGVMFALPAEEAEEERELCAAALARMEEERNCRQGGESPLMDYAAALAGHRYILRCLARGITVAIGDPRSGPAGARSAAQALEEDCRGAASRWLRPKDLCFRRTTGTGGKRPWMK